MLALFQARVGRKHHGTWPGLGETYKGIMGIRRKVTRLGFQRSGYGIRDGEIRDFTIYTPQTRLVLETEVEARMRVRARLKQVTNRVWNGLAKTDTSFGVLGT